MNSNLIISSQSSDFLKNIRELFPNVKQSQFEAILDYVTDFMIDRPLKILEPFQKFFVVNYRGKTFPTVADIKTAYDEFYKLNPDSFVKSQATLDWLEAFNKIRSVKYENWSSFFIQAIADNKSEQEAKEFADEKVNRGITLEEVDEYINKHS